MLKFSILFFLLNNFQIIKGQVFTKGFFENKQWASNNKDSAFYKSDTIKMVSLGNKTALDVAGYFHNNDYVTLNLKKNRKMKFLSHNVTAWTENLKYGSYKWSFNKNEQRLCLYFNNTLFGSFMPISIKKVIVKSSYVYEPMFETEEVIFFRKN